MEHEMTSKDEQPTEVDPRELTDDDLANTTGGKGNFLQGVRAMNAYEDNKARDAATQNAGYPRL